MTLRFAPAFVLAFAVLEALAPGQGSDTVEGRLLEILKENGVISSTQFGELTELARDLREERDFSHQVETRVDEMVAALQDAPPTTEYRKGKGWTWKRDDGKFSLTIGGRIQFRFSHHFWEENPGTNDQEESDFDVRRARVRMYGRAFSKHLRYKIRLDLTGDEADTELLLPNGSTPRFDSDNALSELKDAYIQYERWDFFQIRLGQFKVPYSRQFMTSSAELQFVGRAITRRIFVPGRDVGVRISGKFGGEDDDVFEYYAGVFDGEGENRSNDDHGLMYAGRIAINPFGGVKYRESDLKKSDRFRLALGINAWLHEDDGHRGLKDDWAVGADLAILWHGFSAVFEIHYRENGRRVNHDVEILGWMAQLGYMVPERQFEIALRASEIAWDHNTVDDAGRREYLVVANYFWDDHDLKAQLDFGRIEDHQGDHTDNKDEWRLRFQLQLTF